MCENLREIILNAREPLIFRNFEHNWSCFKQGLSDWCERMDKHTSTSLWFESMPLKQSSTPQWERKRQRFQMRATDFLLKHQSTGNNQNSWCGFNYKRMNELPTQCTDGIDFKCFGFKELRDDCTFWLCSKGANTPCHYDTYGCNIVVQIYGRKSWLLFPPETKLNTTRIPYEESSIYCEENFFSPVGEDLNNLKVFDDKVYHVVLSPNDVLIVPRHWWHYVEALELSLSVNAWVPLKIDIEDQLNECIVKYLMETFTCNASNSIKKYILNPNQLTQITSDERLINILNFLLYQKQNIENPNNESLSLMTWNLLYDYQYLNDERVRTLLSTAASIRINIEPVAKMLPYEFHAILNTHSTRFLPYSNDIKANNIVDYTNEIHQNPMNILKEILINSICSPNVINDIKNILYEKWKKNRLNIEQPIRLDQ